MAVEREILEKLIRPLSGLDIRLRELRIFTHWVIADTVRSGMSTFSRSALPEDTCYRNTYLGDWIGRPVEDIIYEGGTCPDALRQAVAMACLNGALPIPDECFEGNAMDPFAERVKTMPSCFIGHFKEAAAWRDQGAPVTIVELEPRAGDIHWDDSRPALAEAEIVFITGLTLINGTFREVLDRTPKAVYRVLMGPTVPPSPVLFDYGVHLIGSTLIDDLETTVRYCQLGGTSVAKTPPGAVRKINITNRPELRKGI